MNSLRNLKNNTERVTVPKGARQRRLHKALLRYHDQSGWPLIREALRAMGKANLIGKGPQCLVPEEGRNEKQPVSKGRPALTKHTGFSQFKKANTKPRVGDNKKRGAPARDGQSQAKGQASR